MGALWCNFCDALAAWRRVMEGCCFEYARSCEMMGEFVGAASAGMVKGRGGSLGEVVGKESNSRSPSGMTTKKAKAKARATAKAKARNRVVAAILRHT